MIKPIKYKLNSIQTTKHGPYNFGSLNRLSRFQLVQLSAIFENTSGANQNVLGGRKPVNFIELEDIGPVVIKSYGRGGLIRYINTQWYLKLGKPRCQKEFESIINASSLGVGTPEPIAFAITHGIFYRAWLITKEIIRHQTLAEVSVADKQRAGDIMGEVINQIRLLINAGIHHIDLHPGNILVNPENKIFIVDFDKAYQYNGQEGSLKTRYINRWQRAVTKHGLSQMLYERLRDGL